MKYTCKKESEDKNGNILTLQKYEEEQKEIFECTGCGNLNDFLQHKQKGTKKYHVSHAFLCPFVYAVRNH